ncbi:MAG: hypothetical protein AABZ47_06955 [Planctomycetota bacterium]
MAISPIRFTRVTQNLRSDLVLRTIQRTQRDLFLEQSRLATGQAFVAASENPVAAARVLDLTDSGARQARFALNLQYADNFLSATDVSITDTSDLIIQAHTIASQDVGSLISADERAADAEIIASIRRQLQNVGNRQFGGRYLFAGRETTSLPFVDTRDGIAYVGDTGELTTRAGDDPIEPFNIPGNLLFGALTSRVQGVANLSPALTAETRLEDLAGAAGRGVRRGVLVISENAGQRSFTVDINTADTIGDIVELFNQAATAAGSAVTAAVTDQGIDINGGSSSVTVTDVGTGTVAGDLGVRTNSPVNGVITGLSLGPRITTLTPLLDLDGGNGIDLSGGIRITNGSQSALIDLSEAETVQDLLNAINTSDVFVVARINDAGTGLDLINQASGAILSVTENTGTTALALGLRSLHEDTPLSSLNFGRGITLDPTDFDVQISAKDGQTVDVNLDGAVTVGDAIEAINDAATTAGVNVMASVTDDGSGIRLEDSTGGTGALSVISLNQSTASADLGFTGSATGMVTELVSANAAGSRTEGVLSALSDLEAALRRDDTRAISEAAERVNRHQNEVTRVHGVVGARSQGMRAKMQQMQDASQTTEIFLSQARDLDYPQTVTRLQSLQTQLEANLQTSSTLLNLSLMDFLG